MNVLWSTGTLSSFPQTLVVKGLGSQHPTACSHMPLLTQGYLLAPSCGTGQRANLWPNEARANRPGILAPVVSGESSGPLSKGPSLMEIIPGS